MNPDELTTAVVKEHIHRAAERIGRFDRDLESGTYPIHRFAINAGCFEDIKYDEYSHRLTISIPCAKVFYTLMGETVYGQLEIKPYLEDGQLVFKVQHPFRSELVPDKPKYSQTEVIEMVALLAAYHHIYE